MFRMRCAVLLFLLALCLPYGKTSELQAQVIQTPCVQVTEIDGSPSGCFRRQIFPNGMITNNGDGSVSIAAGSGSGPAGATGTLQVNGGSGLFAGATGLLWDQSTGLLDLTYTGQTKPDIHILHTNSTDYAGGTPTQHAAQYIEYDFLGLNPAINTSAAFRGLQVAARYGNASVLAEGTGTAFLPTMRVIGNQAADSEHAVITAALRSDLGTGYDQTSGNTGRDWLFDLWIHGPIGIQPDASNGITMGITNYYNGQPIWNPTTGMTIMTAPGYGTAIDALHAAATTYPVEVGLAIVGFSSGSANGFNTALQIGGAAGPWMGSVAGLTGSSIIGTAIDISQWNTYGIYLHDRIASATGAPAIVVGALDNAANRTLMRLGITTAPSGGVHMLELTHPLASSVNLLYLYGSGASSRVRSTWETNGGNIEWKMLKTGVVSYVTGLDGVDNSFKIHNADNAFTSYLVKLHGTQKWTVLKPTAQTIAAGNTVTADACGSIKSVTSAGAVTTDTTNTFTAPAAANDSCLMTVYNSGANNITLDANALFDTLSDADVVLTPGCSIDVFSTGASGKWVQKTALLCAA